MPEKPIVEEQKSKQNDEDYKANPVTQKFYKRRERAEEGSKICKPVGKRINGEISLQEDYVAQQKKPNEPDPEDGFVLEEEDKSIIDIHVDSSKDSIAESAEDSPEKEIMY